MKKLSEFHSTEVEILFTDIDDTLTDQGRLGPQAYQSLWNLQKNGIKVVPVTGRPAGWCEMIARQWPVSAVIGENGAFYFSLRGQNMLRHFVLSEAERLANHKKLETIKKEILAKVQGSAISSDQFARLFDLAIDYCEDIPRLNAAHISQMIRIFESHGATAKVSSIHVNGWFGTYDKKTMCLDYLTNDLKLSASDIKKKCAFVGDSPNDQPMFEFFPHSFGVANISEFVKDLKTPPTYVANHRGGAGFVEISARILALQQEGLLRS